MNYQDYMKLSGTMIVGLLVLPALAGKSWQVQPSQVSKAPFFNSAKYGLELEGRFAGWLISAESTQDAPEKTGRKQISGEDFEELGVKCGAGMSSEFYQWLAETCANKHTRKGGAIIAGDFNYKEMTRVAFKGALITEVGLPALDAASKEAAKMTIKFSPEYSRFASTAGGGPAIGAWPGPDGATQKKWLCSNFRLRITGLDQACSRVSKIDSFVVKQTVVKRPSGGGQHDYQKEPAALETPNLVITFPESSSKEFNDWHKDFVIQGHNGQDKEKEGTLEYLGPDLKEVLLTVTFHGLRMLKVAPDNIVSRDQANRRIKCEMSCRSIFVRKG